MRRGVRTQNDNSTAITDYDSCVAVAPGEHL